MKMTILEYCDLFYGADGYKHRNEVQKQCRDGELKATQANKNGKWLIDIDVPENVREAWHNVRKKVAYRNALWQEYIKTNKEIVDLNRIIFEYTKPGIYSCEEEKINE